MNTSLEKSLDTMNSFLRGEISAVESYRLGIEKLGNSIHRGVLEEASRSHQKSVELLRAWVRNHNGSPAEGSGVWGGFAKAVEAGAALLSEEAAIAALEEGEDHGRNDYERELEGLSPQARSLVQAQLLPQQLRTHKALSDLKKLLQ